MGKRHMVIVLPKLVTAKISSFSIICTLKFNVKVWARSIQQVKTQASKCTDGWTSAMYTIPNNGAYKYHLPVWVYMREYGTGDQWALWAGPALPLPDVSAPGCAAEMLALSSRPQLLGTAAINGRFELCHAKMLFKILVARPACTLKQSGQELPSPLRSNAMFYGLVSRADSSWDAELGRLV